jgi:hypothetical protein
MSNWNRRCRNRRSSNGRIKNRWRSSLKLCHIICQNRHSTINIQVEKVQMALQQQQQQDERQADMMY